LWFENKLLLLLMLFLVLLLTTTMTTKMNKDECRKSWQQQQQKPKMMQEAKRCLQKLAEKSFEKTLFNVFVWRKKVAEENIIFQIRNVTLVTWDY